MVQIEPIKSNLDLKVLNSEQLEQIKSATLHVLEIEAVGLGGHFLSQKHTRSHLREIWIPELTHPRVAPDGEPEGDIRKRAKAKFDQVLAEHEPQPLEEAVQYEIDSIFRIAEEEMGR